MLPMSEVRVPPQNTHTHLMLPMPKQNTHTHLMLPMSEVRVPPQGLNRIPTLI